MVMTECCRSTGWACDHESTGRTIPLNSIPNTSCAFVKRNMLPSARSCVQTGEFLGKKWIPGKLISKLGQQLSRTSRIFLADFCNGQKDASIGSKVVASFGYEPQLHHALLLVAREASHPQDPTCRRRHGTDQVSADSCRDIGIVTIPANG